MYYVNPRGVTESNDAAYRRAVKNWHHRKAEIDLELAAKEAEAEPSVITALKLSDALKRLNRADEIPQSLDSLNAVGFLNVLAAMADQPGTISRQCEKQSTVKGLIEAFISTKRVLADAKQISRQMFLEYEHMVKVFNEWADQVQIVRVDQIDEVVLERYKDFILRLRDPDFARKAETRTLRNVAIRKRLARVKQLIEWAYETRQLADCPRNLKHFARFRVDDESEKTDDEVFWTIDECKQFFLAATPRTRLYILLATNCAYTQIDIASLCHAYVDWKTGIITRPRHKTKGKTCHKLWAITLDLLKREATPPDSKKAGNGLVLLSSTGQPLVSDSAQRTSRQDTINLAFNLLLDSLIKMRLRESQPELFKLATRARVNMTATELIAIEREKKERATRIASAKRRERQQEKRSFKNFRKTSANLIERQFGDGSRLADQFLGHTQKATKRFYVSEHYDKLFEAIDWLGKHYSFDSCALS